MSKKDEPKETPAPVAPAEPITPPAAPISIMGEPKAPVAPPETVTVKAFSDLQKAVEAIGGKLNELIPKAPTEAPVAPTPEPKKYRLFDEFEVI